MTVVQNRLISLGLLIVCAGLGAYVVVWQTDRSARIEKEEQEKARVFAFKGEDAVRKITLTNGGVSYVLEKEKSEASGAATWMVTAPIRTPAEGTAVDGLAGHLATLKRLRSVGEGQDSGAGEKPDRALFGLEPPRFKVQVTDDSGAVETLLVGKKNSFDGSIYVQREGEDRIQLVHGSLEYQVDKDLFKLRDKRLVAFEAEEVVRLAVSKAGKPSYTLEKDGDTYRLSAPAEWLADSMQASGILSALTSANAKEFVSEAATPEEMKKYGLDTPLLALTLSLKTGAPRHLVVSESKGPGEQQYYATLGVGSPVILLASKWVVDKIAVDPDTLRDKRVAIFAREDVGSITLKKGDKSITFERKQEGDNQSWMITQPEAAKAQDAEVTSLLYRLWNLKAKAIVKEKATPAEMKEAGLDTPAIKAELKKQDGAPIATYLFGSTHEQEQSVTATPGQRIDVVDRAEGDGLNVDPTLYKEKTPTDKSE